MKENVNHIVPETWCVERLGDFVVSEKGKKPKNVSKIKTKAHHLPYVNIQAFEKNIVEEYTDGVGCVLCEEGDFLMVWDGSRSGYIGKAIKGALGSTLVKINFPGIVNDYAYYFLLSKYLQINTRAKGTGTPHVDPGLLWNYQFPIAPYNEQKRIVEKIEELFSDLEKGLEILDKAQKQLKIYRQAVLKWAYEGKLTHSNVKNEVLPDGWEWVQLKQISKVSGGITKNGKRQKLKLQLPFLRVANVYFNRLDLNEIHKIGVNEREAERARLMKNDLIFVEGNGSIEQIGRVALWNGSIKNCLHQNHLIKARLSSQVLPKYALHFYCSKIGRDKIMEQAKSTSGLHTLSLGKIQNLNLPLCSRDEQENILQEIESRLSVCDKIEEMLEESLKQADALRYSILKKAFEGRLVPQDPNDESASLLLQRIKAEREKNKLVKNGKKYKSRTKQKEKA